MLVLYCVFYTVLNLKCRFVHSTVDAGYSLKGHVCKSISSEQHCAEQKTFF